MMIRQLEITGLQPRDRHHAVDMSVFRIVAEQFETDIDDPAPLTRLDEVIKNPRLPMGCLFRVRRHVPEKTPSLLC